MHQNGVRLYKTCSKMDRSRSFGTKADIQTVETKYKRRCKTHRIYRKLCTDNADQANKNVSHESSYKEFKSTAVVSNTGICSTIGKNILQEGGSLVDAAIATKLSLGVVSFQRAGIGGGFFMVYYDAKSKKDYFINAREVAPSAASVDLFKGDDYARKCGRSSIAVPGELQGYYEAHRRFGGLPWSRLFQPAIYLAENGFEMTRNCYNWSRVSMKRLPENKQLRDLLRKEDGTFLKTGDSVRRIRFAETLRTIATEGPDAFYRGSLTEYIMKDINDGFGRPSIITKNDLTRYRALVKRPVKFHLDDLTFITSGAPSGGPVLAHLLNILKGYRFTTDDWCNNKALTIHRMIEAIKFAYCKRSRLGDPEVNDEIDKLVGEMISEEYCNKVRSKIDDIQTHPPEYYGSDMTHVFDDHGTAHVGILGEDGSAISVTSSINKPFYSVIGQRTGIIFNNSISEFSNEKGVHGKFTQHSNNLIEPGKRPMSSMSPTIILRKTPNGSSVRMVLGGAGGSHIISSSAQALVQRLWFKRNVNEAVKEKRIHHNWLPDTLFVQENTDEEIIDDLANRGHNIQIMNDQKSSVQIIEKLSDNKIVAKCDERRGGYPNGY
uniref:glutathione hydrolase 1 proenzyme-like isoform X2 n=1 Tax=Styela clava TaxID=7725 RepID=UPI00193A7289|nr:glutathione hydrolase 1 proenzyme-like isoform X2 [Styela clava]